MRPLARRAVSALLTLAAMAGGAAAIGAGSALCGDEPRKQDVSNMDLDLLRENLLKLWIIEFTSHEYNWSRIAQISFEGLISPGSTGDPELDRKNEEGRKKTEKSLRHYLLLELDGCIEAQDICDRVLGAKAQLSAADIEKRRFFFRELDAIKWNSILLQDALAELSRATGTPIALHPEIPKNVTLEVSLDAPKGFSVQNVLEYLSGMHPIEWKYEGGKLDVTYLGDIPRGPYGR